MVLDDRGAYSDTDHARERAGQICRSRVRPHPHVHLAARPGGGDQHDPRARDPVLLRVPCHLASPPVPFFGPLGSDWAADSSSSRQPCMSCGRAPPRIRIPPPGGHCLAETPPTSGPSSGWPDRIKAVPATSLSRWPNCSYAVRWLPATRRVRITLNPMSVPCASRSVSIVNGPPS